MIRIEREVLIERGRDDVFSYVSDPTNIPQWQSGVEAARKETEGPMDEGARWTEVRKFLGRRVEQTVEATAYEPAREFSLRVVSGPVAFHVRHLFEEHDGGTRLRVIGEGEPGRAFKLGRRLLVAAVERQFDADLSTLRQLLERRS